MENSKQNKKSIAFVVKSSLEYDDRVRKIALDFAQWAEVKIFVNTPENVDVEGVTSYGVPYRSFRLLSRDWLPSRSMVPIKTLEFSWRTRNLASGFDMLWSHDIAAMLCPAVSKNKYNVLDLHELPDPLLKGSLGKRIYKLIEKRCDFVAHANEQRKEYLFEHGLVVEPAKHLSIRNFPDSDFVDSEIVDDRFDEFSDWLNGEPYVYLQGLQMPGRFPEETLTAALRVPNLKILVVGNVCEIAKKHLIEKFGDSLNERVFFRGMVNQLATPLFMKNAHFTMVFYNSDKPNNRLCEPNRLFQSVVLGVPAIVGCNEPMKAFVEGLGVGLVLNGDGRDVDEIEQAIRGLLANHDEYAENARRQREGVAWDSQKHLLREIYDSIL